MTVEAGLPVVVFFLALQGFFSGSEMALVSANRARLQTQADGGHPGARMALSMLEGDEARLLGTCLIGTNVCLISGTTVVGAILLSLGYTNGLLVTALYVPVVLLLGEALPKLVYRHYADSLAPFLARPIRAFQVMLAPALLLVRKWSDLLERLLQSEGDAIRREDIVQLLDGETGHIAPQERAFIQRLLAMNETTVEECMTPLVHVHGVPETATVGEATEMVLRHGHSRLPVYRDRVDNIIGRIGHHDLLFAAAEADSIEELVRPVQFVPESKRVDHLLRDMREDSVHFAVVVDEYGGSVGLVTLEDLLEEVIGEIQDERDRHGPGIRRLSDREWRVPARVELEEFEEVLARPLPRGDYETVAGLLLAAAGRIPETGESLRIGRLTFHVEAASDRAIHLVRVTTPLE